MGDGACNATYQGPVLLEADAPVFVLVQVTDEFVSRSTVPSVLGETAEPLTPGQQGKQGAGWGGPHASVRRSQSPGPMHPSLTVSMWLSSQLSILRKSFLLMRRGFLQQQRRLEYLSKLFTSTWTAHSSSVHSAITACGHLWERGSGTGALGPSTSPCWRTRGGRAGSVPPKLTVPSLRVCTGIFAVTSPRVTASPRQAKDSLHRKAKSWQC